jgi:hypothetical protein
MFFFFVTLDMTIDKEMSSTAASDASKFMTENQVPDMTILIFVVGYLCFYC